MSENKMEPILETRGLGISFGGLRAVQDFNLRLYPGELAGLIGPNGAGKTTVFNLLTGVYAPTEGSVLLDGQVLNGKKTHQFVAAGVARTFQNIRLFKQMSVIDNVKAAFSNVAFPLDDIEVFHSDRGSEFCNGEIDALLGAFDIERSVSRPGNPYDNAVVESMNRVLKRELVRGRAFTSEERLRLELFDWVNWYNNCRLHSTLGYMTPVGFREAGLVLS